MTKPPPAHSPDERELERIQKKLTEAVVQRRQSKDRRDALAFRLWQDGMSQNELAERLDRADRAAGGDGVEPGAVQKTLFRYRKRLELS